MNKILKYLVIFVLVVFVFSVSTTAEEIEDVSPDHWAYESVQTLIDKGYVSLYDDDTFKGENKVSRYELAEILAKVLEDVQSGTTQISEEDAESVKELSLEFRDELVDLAQEQDDLFEEVEEIKEKETVQDDALGKVREDITRIEEEELSNIEEEVSTIIDDIIELKDLQEKVENQGEEVEEYRGKTEELESDLKDKNEQLGKIDDQLADISGDIGDQEAFKDLEDRQSVTQTNVHNLDKKVSSLENLVEDQEEEIQSLKEQNNNYRLYLGAVAVFSLILSAN